MQDGNKAGRPAYLTVALVGLLLAGTAGAAWAFRAQIVGMVGLGGEASEGHGDGHGADEAPVTRLGAVKPHLNASELVHAVTQPTFVQAYHRADLMARVAGTVKAVHKNIGDPVKKGEVLIELDVSDLDEEVALKEAMVKLAEQEARAAQASLLAVTAASKEAVAMLGEKAAEVDRARSKQKYHSAVYRRVRLLAQERAVEEGLVDERLKNVEAADADIKSALASHETGKANAEEFAARVQQAKVDIEVKAAKVAAAKADLGRARAFQGYARICAPFDGQVVSRRVDPGAFVQNASTGRGETLMGVVRTDKVTLVMWVPEREAPLVRVGAEATVLLDALRGKPVKASVSRVSNWLDPDKSRDMRVEADVDNPGGLLRVGMYGSMSLVLQRFDKARLLPAGAVFVRGGQAMICEAAGGKARFHRVRILYEDGVRVMVAKLVQKKGPDGRAVDEEGGLAGDEVIVRGGQGELRDGQEIEVTMSEW